MDAGQEVVHIVNEHLWIVVVLMALVISFFWSMLARYSVAKKLKDANKQISTLQSSLEEADIFVLEQGKTIDDLKEKVRNQSVAVYNGLRKFCDVHGVFMAKETMEPVYLEDEGEAVSADTGMTALEEAELDEHLMPEDDEGCADLGLGKA